MRLPPPGSYPTDDAPDGDGPDLEVFPAENGDWYACVIQRKPLVVKSEAVRFATSGGRDDVVVMLVAALHAALTGDDDAVRLRCEAAVDLLGCGYRLSRFR